MSKKSEYIHIGNIVAVYGIRGEVKIHSFASNHKDFLSFKQFYDQYGNNITLKLRIGANNKIIAQLNDITTRDQASSLIGIKLFVEYKEAVSLNEDEYLYEDLIGLKVFDQNNNLLGTVKALHNFGAGDLIEILYTTTNETEFFAFTKEIIPEINFEKGYIMLICPEAI